MQFEYIDRRGANYKYTSQLGVIIKREYPGLVQDKDQHGVVLRTRATLDWADYFLSKKDNLGQTAGDRVLSEFWRLFEVNRGKEEEADHVLETYLKKRVKDMMYQARVDAVKVYYKRKLGQNLDDKLARPIELKYEEYLEGKLKWCSTDVWPKLCRHWCSEDFLKKRKRGQQSRFSSDDIAQNHGGSRPFGETRQVLGEKFGPEFATVINTYSVMKSGIQIMDENGRTGPMVSRKAQKIVDEYTAKSNAAHPENSGQEELDAKVLYDVSGGMRHGRVAIANGAIRKADVLSAVKEKSVAPSNSVSYRRMAKENRRLRHANRCLHERVDQLGELTNDIILNLYSDLGKEVPASLKSRLAALATNLPTSSSHVGDEDMQGEDMEESDTDEDLDGEDMENEDFDGEDMDGMENDLDGEDMDGKDWNAMNIDEAMDGEDWGGENIGSNNGGQTYYDNIW